MNIFNWKSGMHCFALWERWELQLYPTFFPGIWDCTSHYYPSPHSRVFRWNLPTFAYAFIFYFSIDGESGESVGMRLHISRSTPWQQTNGKHCQRSEEQVERFNKKFQIFRRTQTHNALQVIYNIVACQYHSENASVSAADCALALRTLGGEERILLAVKLAAFLNGKWWFARLEVNA